MIKCVYLVLEEYQSVIVVELQCGHIVKVLNIDDHFVSSNLYCEEGDGGNGGEVDSGDDGDGGEATGELLAQVHNHTLQGHKTNVNGSWRSAGKTCYLYLV